MVNYIDEHISNSIDVKNSILKDRALISKIEETAIKLRNTLLNGNKIIFAGNGGSFADSQHLAAEFVSKLKTDRDPLASLALGTNASYFSACGNDYGFENVFARELSVLGCEGDYFIPISTSGNSKNILAAVKMAKLKNINVVALTGATGGALEELCSTIKVPSFETALVQEAHIMIGHILCGLAEIIE